MASHSAQDLFGQDPYAPSAEAILDAEAAIKRCRFVCARDPNHKGCTGFAAYEAQAKDIGRSNWLLSHILPAGTPDASQITARVLAIVPSTGPKCLQAKSALAPTIDAYVLGGGDDLAKGMANTVSTCDTECRGLPTASAQCRTVSESALRLEEALRYNASSIPLDPEEVCEAGTALYDGDPSKQIRAARYQRWRISVGGAIGFVPQKYLRQVADESGSPLVVDILDEDGNPTGQVQPQLEEHSATSVAGSLGLAAGVLPLSGMTFEGRFLYSRNAIASPKKAEWCETQGIVGASSDDPPAESCTTRAMKAPTVKHTLVADAYVGKADLERGVYRAAIGPRWVYANTPHDGARAKHSLGVRIPVALNLLAAPRNEGKLDYDGLIRFTPYFDAVLQKGEDTAYEGGLLLELLGKRSLFSTKYDEL